MNELFKQVKDNAPSFGVLLAAALYFGLVGPGQSTPKFLIPKAE